MAVKATQLIDATARVPAAFTAGGTVVPFLNGVDHLPYLRAVYPADTVAATIVVEATKLGDGTIEQASPSAAITLAERAAAPAADCPRAACSRRARPGGDGQARRGAGHVAETLHAGHVRPADHGRGTVPRPGPRAVRGWVGPLVREACAAAAMHDAKVDPDAVEAQIRGLPAQARSSMLKDRLAGRELELDAIAGPTLRTLGAAGAPVTLRAVQTIQGAR